MNPSLVVLDTDLRVMSVNHSFYQTFKVKPEDTKGKLIYDLGNRQWNISKLRVLLEEIIPRDNQFQNFEVEHEFPTIGRKIMLLNARQIYSKGIGAHMILLAIEDITERKKAEDQIKTLNEDLKHRAIELEAAYKELETFSYSVSHDLRTPLVVIGGFSRVLLEKYSNHLDANGQRFLSIIHSNADKMLQLIDDLLTFSRSEHQQMKPSDIDMGELAKAVFEELKSILPEQTLRLDIKTLPPAHGDPSMIRQIFANLLSNAIKFTRPKGAGVIQIGCMAEENQNIYCVKDNVSVLICGMPVSCLESFNDTIPSMNLKEPALGLPLSSALFTDMVEKYGLKERSRRAHHFISRFQEEKNKMEIIMVEILWAKIILQE